MATARPPKQRRHERNTACVVDYPPTRGAQAPITRVYGPADDVLRAACRARDTCNDAFPSPAPDDADAGAQRFRATVAYLLEDVRQGVIALVRAGTVRALLVVINSEYRNGVSPLPSSSDVTRFREGKAAALRNVVGVRACESDAREPWLEPHAWWFNRHIVCTTPQPHGWGTAMLPELVALCARAASLCASAGSPLRDGDVVLNRRDAPLFRVDGTHPYSRASARAWPIRTPGPYLRSLSLYTGTAWCDGALVEPLEPPRITPRAWYGRHRRAFFRGSSTGGGVGTQNQRVALALLASANSHTLDCGIVRWSLREQMRSGKLVHHNAACRTLAAVPTSAWGSYRMHVYVMGYSAALRYTALLASGAAILRVATPSTESDAADKLWYFDQLRAFPEYALAVADHVIVRSDLSNLLGLARWLDRHPWVAHRLARNARAFFDDKLRENDARARALGDQLAWALNS